MTSELRIVSELQESFSTRASGKQSLSAARIRKVVSASHRAAVPSTILHAGVRSSPLQDLHTGMKHVEKDPTATHE